MYVLDNGVVNNSLHSEALRYKIETIGTVLWGN